MSAIADPVLAAMVDALLERGAKLEMWTDEEAERCRLVAFDVAQRTGGIHHRGMLRPVNTDTNRDWVSDHYDMLLTSGSGGTYSSNLFANERWFSEFEPHDHGLAVGVDPAQLVALSKGLRLPKKFRPAKAVREFPTPKETR